MEWLYSAVKFSVTFLGGKEETVYTVSAEPCLLLDLPPELLLLIAEKLPLASATCLARCNSRLRELLGPSTSAILHKADPVVRYQFLLILAKDLPKYFACHICARLHRSSKVPWPGALNTRIYKCWRPNVALNLGPSTHYSLYFAPVHLVMKRHRQGPEHGIPLEALRHISVTGYSSYHGRTLHSVDYPRIVDDELLVRSQLMILQSPDIRNLFIARQLYNLPCYHIWAGTDATRYGNMTTSSGITKRMENVVQTLFIECTVQGRSCTEIMQCLECHTDFTLEVVDFPEKERTAIIVTRWTNYGAALDVKDAKWQCHHQYPQMAEGVVHQPHRIGSICTSFEGQDGASLEDFTAENILQLITNTKRQWLINGGSWTGWRMW